MKRYTKPTKRVKVSKRMLEARMGSLESVAAKAKLDAEWTLQHLRKARANLGLEQIRSKAYHNEAAKLRERLEKVTEPVWRHAHVYADPPPDITAEERLRLWSIEGACRVGIAVEFRHVRSMPRGDREEFLAMLVEDFTRKAREQAIANLRVLLD